MAEMSMLWATNGVGHGAAPYTQAQSNEFFRYFNNANPATAGVLSGILNELEVSGVASPLAVNTGYGDVYGFRYWNDASKNVTVTTPAGDRGGRVVLRADWTLQTVTAEVIINAGGATLPSLTQVANTTWEISLASFVIDSSGDIWTDSSKTVAGVTDERHFLISPLAGMVKLRETVVSVATGSIQWTNIQSDLSHLLIVGQARGTNASTSIGINMRFNNDTGTNYRFYSIFSENPSYPSADTVVGGASPAYSSLLVFSAVSAASGSANFADLVRIEIPNYARSTFYKCALSHFSPFRTGTTTGAANVSWGWWQDTDPINRIDLIASAGNFEVGSVLTLYGLR